MLVTPHHCYLVKMLPVKVLMTDLVSVWKHSMWILCTGLVVFSISEQGGSKVRRHDGFGIWIMIRPRCTQCIERYCGSKLWRMEGILPK